MPALLHVALLISVYLLAAFAPPAQADDGANTLVAAEAFLDASDRPAGTGTPLNLTGASGDVFREAQGALDLSGVAAGNHTVYVRFQDAAGLWSTPIGQSFYIVESGSGGSGGSGGGGTLPPGSANRIKAAEAFFDADPGTGKGVPLTVADDGAIDSSLEILSDTASLQGLEPGSHTVYIRFQDATGLWSEPVGQSFYIAESGSGGGLPPGSANHIQAAEAFFDIDPGKGRGTPITVAADGAIDSSLEILSGTASLQGLDPGIHTVYVRFLDANGLWSNPIQQSFYLSPISTGPGPGSTIAAAEISIDGGPFRSVPAEDGAFDDMVETIAVQQAVTQDYHTVRIRFRDSAGVWSGTEPPPPPAVEGDSDWDGLPDSWEQRWFGTLSQTGLDDPDQDGFNNFEEYRRGQNPLVPDVGGRLTISGFVRTADGQPLSGIAVCISGASVSNCDTLTDQFGHYVLGASATLPAGSYTVTPQSTSATGPYNFAPPSAAATIATTHVAGIDFAATYIPDTTPPDTAITAGPTEGSVLTVNNVSFAWSGSDDRSSALTYAYQLDNGAWSAFGAATTLTLTDLSDGAHRFAVKARDQAGNEDPTPAMRNFTVDTTPPTPPSGFTATLTANAVRLNWTHSTSPDIAAYRLYGDQGTGTINYATPLATIAYPATTYTLSVTTAGTYRFGLRAVDQVGHEETNTNVVATVTVTGFSVTLTLENQTYDRGQSVPFSGKVSADGGAPLVNLPVVLSVQSMSGPRTYTAYTDASGGFRYTFQPLGSEAGSYTVTALASYNGLEQQATAGFRLLGLWLQPTNVTVRMSMNSSQTVDLQLRNIGDVTLSTVQYSIEDADPADPVTATLDSATLPTSLAPGAAVTVPVTLHAAAGTAPAAPIPVTVRVTAAEGAVETAVINAELQAAVGKPVVTPDPLKAGVQPGKAVTQLMTVTNAGYAALLDTRVTLHDPQSYPWITVLNGELGALEPQQAKEVQIYVNPPANTPLGTRVVQLDLSYNGQTQPVYFTVEITAATTGKVSVTVYDDTGATVNNAEVNLISKAFYVNSTPQGQQEYPNVIKGSTDTAGRLLLSDVPTGGYRYQIRAAGHDPAEGELTVEAGTTPQELKVILVTNLVTVDFNVKPTTIQDQYEVTLNITYATDLTKPALYAQPSTLNLSFFPEDNQAGTITITNTSNNVPVRDVELRATELDSTDNEIVLVFGNGERTLKLDNPLGPKESIQIPFTARIPNAATAKLNSRYLSNIIVTGNYTFSIQGEAHDSTTTTPVPVFYQRPTDLCLPSIRYTNNEKDGNLNDLQYQGTTYRLAICSQRDIQFVPAPTLKAVSHINGGSDAASIIEQNVALWTGEFNELEPLHFKGDTASFDIDGLQEALEAQLAGPNRQTFLNTPRSLGFSGQWQDRTAPDAYLIPIDITTIRPGTIIDTTGGGGGSGGGYSTPPVPTLPSGHGEVKIQISQKVSLERQAFDATRLPTTPNLL
jgi:hypothetical protein